MSTEHQKYSTENQSEAIRNYAARRGLEIVKTYTDAGKSGLRIDGRDGFRLRLPGFWIRKQRAPQPKVFLGSGPLRFIVLDPR